FEKILEDCLARTRRSMFNEERKKREGKNTDLYNELASYQARKYLDSWRRGEQKIDSDASLI
ncbi:MAG: hypothetical protein WAM42_25825, partial [Candidatus Nitrosopolaris sp.]